MVEKHNETKHLVAIFIGTAGKTGGENDQMVKILLSSLKK